MRVAITSNTSGTAGNHQVEFCIRCKLTNTDNLIHTGVYAHWSSVHKAIREWLTQGQVESLNDILNQPPI